VSCCNKNCNQGRNCPARQACEIPIDVVEPDSILMDLIRTAGWPLAGLLALLVISFTAGFLAG